jgi:biopolymer transport protein TolR
MSFGRLERPASQAPMSDINMTPLIDVMLVLLVIFIITAPLLAGSLKLELPQTNAATPSQAPAVLAVSIDRDGVMRLDETIIDQATLTQRAQAAARRNHQTEAHLRIDTQVPYGRVATLIGWLQEAGLTRIGFVTEPVTAAKGG